MAPPTETQFGSLFTYQGWDFSVVGGTLKLHYTDAKYGDFTETFHFPKVDQQQYDRVKEAIEPAFDCLFWMAGVSYYKTTLAKDIQFTENLPSLVQAQWLTQTWQSGLAELAFENQLPWLSHIKFDGKQTQGAATKQQLAPRSLVAIGGGKDSLVSVEAIKAMGEPAHLFMVGQSEFIIQVAGKTGLPLLQVQRQVDQKLKLANQQGAYNGHVPITAINACVAVVAALLYDFDSVVFSNERSADSGNFKTAEGQWVNHQYSKSLEYEQQWQQVIQQHICPGLHCFSLLRPFSELAIVEKFAQLKQYFPWFSSCNRNFHLAGSHNHQHHWCGECPKCAFVFLCLAPFVEKSELLDIFNQDLLADIKLIPLFESLLGITGVKPFECVGEEHECRLALQLLATHPDWQDHQQLNHWRHQVARIADEDAMHILAPSQRHMIPAKRQFQQVMDDET